MMCNFKMHLVICFRTVEDNESSRLSPNDNTYVEVDDHVEGRHIAWPAVFILSRDSIRTQILTKLDKKLQLTEPERTSLFAAVFHICMKHT